MSPLPATNKQVPEHAIMDLLGKQPYLGNQFMAGSNSAALSGTAEVPVLYIACPSAVAQGVGVFQNAKGIFCSLLRLYCADQSEATGIVYRIYFAAATISGGTPIVPINMRQANPNASVASVLLSPTVGSKGTFVYSYAVGFESPATARELTIIDPGMNMLITAQPSASSTGIVDLSWYEL
jgi:hypothetical protein